jgi:hypothetical protein
MRGRRESAVSVLDIAKCARPVLFQNEDADWPLSNGGTGFVVNFRNRHFVVTAKHVLNLDNFELGQFRIQYRPDLNQFLPLSAVLYDDPIEGELDTDQFDVAVFSVDEATLQVDLFGDYPPYSLRAFDRMTVFSAAAAYVYKGYPISERRLDFENENDRNALMTGVTTRATYVGRTNLESVRELALLDLQPVQDIDGMSGSPVFQVINDADGVHSIENFAGMLIRGGLAAGRAFFLEHRRIVELLERMTARADR